METSRTSRGFSIAKFKDRYGNVCSLQKSSLATEDCIWLGVDDADPRVMAVEAARFGICADKVTGWVPYPIPECVGLTTRMHLSREQVADLLPHLQKFVATGEL